MVNVTQAYFDSLQWESDFEGWPLIWWIQANWYLPVISSALYLALVFVGPHVMKGSKPVKSKAVLALWNLSLSIFSWIGVSRCVPHLAEAVWSHGFRYTLCTHPQEWYMKGGVALWMGMFCISKLPELVDTVFLVLRKKPVIFLHWYHHLTVLLYCWHAYHHTIPPGIWFASMNYTVHGIMYFYYFLMATGRYKLASRFSGVVTSLQILQMIIGSAVMGFSGYLFLTEGSERCYNNRENVLLGFAMYISYFALFAAFAVKRYLRPSSAARGGPAKKLE